MARKFKISPGWVCRKLGHSAGFGVTPELSYRDSLKRSEKDALRRKVSNLRERNRLNLESEMAILKGRIATITAENVALRKEHASMLKIIEEPFRQDREEGLVMMAMAYFREKDAMKAINRWSLATGRHFAERGLIEAASRVSTYLSTWEKRLGPSPSQPPSVNG